MTAEQFTPTTEQVRHGFAVDPESEYRDPLTNHTLYGERAFDRWLAKHDAEVKAQALEEFGAWAQEVVRAFARDGHASGFVDGRYAAGTEALRRAAATREGAEL